MGSSIVSRSFVYLFAACLGLLTSFSAVGQTTQTVTITTPGANSWTVPAGVSRITVEVWGGGGGGGNSDNTTDDGGGGGGGGAYSIKVFNGPLPASFNYSIGAGGAGAPGSSGTNAIGGQDTWFSSATTLMAKGGSRGRSSDEGSNGGNGGAAGSSIGDNSYSGGSGANGGDTGGAGGGSAGPSGAGNNGSGNGATSAVTGGGAGGNGGSTGNPGGAGGAPGGGGGGSNDIAAEAGGNGANGQIVITYVVPEAFTVGSVTVTGGTLVAGRWNSTSTGVNVQVPIDNDATLNGGNVQLQARISSGSFANVGSATALAGGDLGTTKTIALTAVQFEGIASFANGETIQVTAIITNNQGNSTTGTTSASTILVDQASPAAFTVGTVTPTGGTVVAGRWNASNTGVDIQVPIANDASLNGGSLQLQGRISSGSFANLGSAVALAGGDINGTKTISLTAAQFEGIAGFAEGVTLQVTALLTDASGNPATTGTQSATNTVVDQVAPAAFATGAVVTTGGNVIANLWNNTNTGISVSVPVANEATLNGGSIQLQARISSGVFANIGSALTLAGGDLGTTKTVTATKAQLEAIAGFANGETIEITAVIFDIAGNGITGTTSASTLVVNQTAPAAFTVGTITTTGGTVVSAHWNASNTGVDIQVPIANDASLDGGSLQLQARIASGSFANFGAAVPLITTDVNTTKTLSFTAAQFEAIAGFANGQTVQVTAILTDVTGNVTTGTQSATNVLVDQAAPAAFTVGTITATGGTVVANFWNSTNTGINISVPVANDASLDGGTVQLQARITSGSFANLGTPVAVVTGDINGTKVVSITAAQFEAIAGFANGETIEVTAILADNAGNATTGTTSATTIAVDQAAPAAFATGSVVTLGGTIVAGRWNASNTDIEVQVPIANDASLTGGSVQLQGRITSGSFANLGSAVVLAGGDLNTTKTISLTDAQFEGIAGFANGQTVEITAVLTDAAGNGTTGTTSATTIAVDQAAPATFTVGTVTPTGGVVKAGRWNASNTGVDIQVPVANDASLNGGSIQLRGRTTSGSFANLGAVVMLAGGDVNTTKTISLTDAQFEGIAGFADGQTIEITAVLTDVAGNTRTGTASASTIVIDQTAPAAFVVGSVTVTGGTVMAGIWNNTNTGINVQVPVANEATLDGGSIQIQARIASGSFANVGSAVTLAAVDLNTTKTIAITAAQLEAIAGFADGETVEITAIISDVAGNATTGTTSATTIAVDQSAPAAFTVGTVTPTGGTIITGRWNASNTGVDIQVPIANDASLNGGTLQLQGRISSGSFADLGSTIVLAGGDVNTTKTISLTDTQFEGIAGFANGVTIQITAILTDNVGNSTTGTQSATNTVVDQTAPAAFTVGTVTTTGGRVVANYWNSTNTGVDIVVPIANDATLNGGSVQLQARISSGTFANVGSASAIAAVNTNKTVSLSAAQFEAIASFAENTDIQIRAVISDVAGNATTGAQSTTVLHVDQTAPSIASAVKVYANKGGGPANGGGTNNHEVIQFTLSEDITLTHGTSPKFSGTYGNQGFSVDDGAVGSTTYANNASANTIDGTSFTNTRLIYLESSGNSSNWSVANATNVQYVPSGVGGSGNLIIDIAGNEMLTDIKPVTNGDAIKPFISPDVMTLYPRAGNPEKIVFTMSEELGLASGAAVTGFFTSTGAVASAVYTDNAGGAPYTITLTSSANGDWTSSTTVSYTTASGGNVKDVATNEMNTVTAHALVVETDAPVISSVSIPNTPMKVGDVVTVTITTTNDDGDDPVIVAGSTIGGFPLTFTNAAGTSKIATFTVAEDGTDVAAGSNIPVTLTLQDGQGNTSTTYTTAIAQGNDRIDANAPTVVSITRATTVNSFSTTGGTTATSVVYRVTFSENIDPASIDANDFIFTPTTSIGGTPTIQAPVAFSGTSVYDVTVTGYTGTGRIELMFKDSENAQAVMDIAGNPVITSASNTDGSVTGPLYTIVLPEPTANASGLSVTVNNTTSITLNWVNPVAPVQPASQYLIRVKGPDINDAPGSYTPVADGTFLTPTDLNFNDGNGFRYVSAAATATTFTTLLSGKTYDFEIIPLTVVVSNDNRDYLFTGNPTIQGTTPAAELGAITVGTTAPPLTISSLSTSFTNKNFTFKVQDDGLSLSADNSKTRFGTLTIFEGSGDGIANWADVIAEAELKDITEGNTVTTTVIGTNTITFTLPTTDNAAGELDDNELKEYELRIRLKGPMDNSAGDNIDNSEFVFNVNASSFTSYVAGSSKIEAAQTQSSSTGANKVDVIATQLDFTVQPPGSVFVLADLTTQPVVRARDTYGNTDANYNATLTVSNAGNLPIFDAAVTPPASAVSTTAVTMVNGIATFPVNFRYGESGNGTLSVDDGNLATTNTGSTSVTVIYSSTTTITAGANTEHQNLTSLGTGLYSHMVFDFEIKDDNGSGGDGAPTRLSQVKVSARSGFADQVSNWGDAIAGAILYDNNNSFTIFNATSITADEIVFNGLNNGPGQNGYIPDNGANRYQVYIWFKAAMGGTQPDEIDNKRFILEVTEADITPLAASSKIDPAAVTHSDANGGLNNNVQVIATKMVFTVNPPTPPTDVLVNTDLPTPPKVVARDINNNRDWDYEPVTGVVVTTEGNLTTANPPTSTSGILTFTDGVLTFPANFKYTQVGNGKGRLTVSSSVVAANGAAPSSAIGTDVKVRTAASTTITAIAASSPDFISSLETSAPGVTVFEFDVEDDGGAEDDGVATQITSLSITYGGGDDIAGSSNYNWTDAIGGATLSDEHNNTVSVATINSNTLIFNLTAGAGPALGLVADGDTETYTLKLWLKNPVSPALAAEIDGLNFVFDIQTANIATYAEGSGIAPSQTGNSGSTKNVVDVDATQLDFTTLLPGPVSASINTPFATAIRVEARDARGNTDLDFNGDITAFSNTGAGTPSPVQLSMSNAPNPSDPLDAFSLGVFTFNGGFQFTSDGNGENGAGTLHMTAGGITGNSPSITVQSSYESKLVINPVIADPTIDYIKYQATSPGFDLTSSNSVILSEFTLYDGDADGDIDGANTILSSFTVSITNSANIRDVALYNAGGTEIPGTEQTVNGAATVTFSGLSITAADMNGPTQGSMNFTLRATFMDNNTDVNDGDLIDIKVTAATLSVGSRFIKSVGAVDYDPLYIGGVLNGSSAPQQKIEITATKLDFTTQPDIFAGINEPVITGVVAAHDQLGLLDEDFILPAALNTPGANISAGTYTFSGGVLDLSGMQYSSAGDGTITVTAGTLSSNATGSVDGIPNVSTTCNHIDVIHVTATENTNGVISTPNLKRGASEVVIFGITFNAQHYTSAQPELKGFSFIFDKPYKTQTSTTFKNFKVFESTNGVYTGATLVTGFGGDVTEQQSPLLPLGTPSAVKDMVTVTFAPGTYRNLHNPSSPLTYYLVADVDPTVTLNTPKIRVQMLDDGYYSSPNTNASILTTKGSATANIVGKEYSFASTRPPSLVSSYPNNGQLNVNPAQNTISLTFDVGVWSLDGIAKLYDRQNNKLVDTVYAINGRYAMGEPVAGSVTNPTPLTFQIPSTAVLKPDSVYYLTIEKGTFDPISNTGKGISDDGSNLFGGISYNGTLYFKIASNNPPKLKETEPLRYYLTQSGGSLNASFDQFGKAYFMVVPQNAAKPTNTEIKDALSGYPSALARGVIDIKQIYPNTQFGTFTASLAPGTYDVWMYAENDALPSAVSTSAPYGPKTSDPTTSFAVGGGSAGNPTFKITIPVSSGSLYLNNPTYTICSNSTTTLADPIIIAEGVSGEFNHGSQNFNVLLPTGFEFDTDVNPTITLSGSDFDQTVPTNPGQLSFSYLSGSVLNINFINNNNASMDKIIISNIRVRGNTGASGEIKRFAGNGIPTLADGRRLAGISAISAQPLTFTNTFATNNDFTSIGISNVVTSIPDNFIDKNLGQLAVRLTPNVPTGDYGPFFFNGSGVTNDVLSLTGVQLNSAFDITMTHTDMNGCISTKTDQYEVYDHINAIPALIESSLGPKTCIDNPGYTNGNPAGSLKDPAKIVKINSKAGYSLRELYANIPVTATKLDTTLASNPSTAQIMHGTAWQNLVSQIPIVETATSIGKSYNWDYSVLLPLNPTLDPFKYFREVTPMGRTYYTGGSIGKVEFTGKYQSTADETIQIPLRQEIEIFIPAIPVVEVSGQTANDGAIPIFCQNGNDILINGYPAANAGSSTGYFMVTDALSGSIIYNAGVVTNYFKDNGNGTAVLKPSGMYNDYKTMKIQYVYQDNNSPCSKTAELLIRIAPNPVAQFTALSASTPNTPVNTAYCENIAINFNASSSTILNGTIVNYKWDFTDATNSDGTNPNEPAGDKATAEIVSHKFKASAEYNPVLVVTSNYGCQSDAFDVPLAVGAVPVVKFSFDGVSTADQVRFTNESEILSSSTVGDGYARLDWNYGHGSPENTSNPATVMNHQYTVAGKFNANLKVTSVLGCVNEATKPIVIVPQVNLNDNVDAYFADFQSNGQGYQDVAATGASSWQYGIPAAGTVIGDATDDSNGIWTTSLSGTYNPKERSALYTAAFDIYDLIRPIITFNSFRNLGQGDGVVLEYSIDNYNIADDARKQWIRLGEIKSTTLTSTGVNWYNGLSLPSKPGEQTSGDNGWTGPDLEWRPSKHSLAEIPKAARHRVVFRFALASVSDSPTGDGFAIDEVRVGNGTRTVLIENFTNTASADASVKVVSDTLKTFQKANEVGLEVIKLNYHVAFPGEDPFNVQNPLDPGARALYYGVSTVPQTRLDGTFSTTPGPLFSQWGRPEFDSRILDLANAEIKVKAEIVDNALTITGSFKPLLDLARPTILHVAVVEKNISLTNNPELNSGRIRSGETEFEYVLRKMLPNGAGTKYSTPIAYGQTVEFGPFTWSNATLFKPQDDVQVIVFLQDEDSKVIYQSFITKSVNDPGIVTGIEDLNASFNVYPNPADKEMTVELPETATQRATLRMYDQLGKVVEESYFEKGDSKKTIGTESFAGGVYLIQVETPKGILRRKVMVTHRN
ncbi:T9SS type A sorting domain-containing protein [Fulvivirgaceae bacterium PWU4]|uniref:T9SS type A sorting domain-containing protein n=1 Tax=Chryseosolibacter histidini TaxID=2782349 RepID=A0AAP2DLH6_9BACT|nr:PKD domain-containing protein [Chryseosolibacter histidini]MBT1697483.1 T9SS type A sorting domain-containing protein [Chryseosolibacter histidini]